MRRPWPALGRSATEKEELLINCYEIDDVRGDETSEACGTYWEGK